MVDADTLQLGVKSRKKTEVVDANKHFRLRKALDLCWASKQEQPSKLRKA